MDQKVNPLQKYFRTPGTMMKLPSGGKFQPQDNVSMSASGDVAILPMRGADEMLMKSPDALMSGFAVEQMLLSCVHGLKDATVLPVPDVDALLLAIRAATYGDIMHVDDDCPHCQHANSFAFSISGILDSYVPLKDEYVVRFSNELLAYLRPFNLKNSTNVGIVAFQEARSMQMVETGDMSEDEKRKITNESYRRLTDINTRVMADCVMQVVTPEGVVSDPEFIVDFVNNISREWQKLIEDGLKEINEAGIQKDHLVACAKCNNEWETKVEFDPANFFG